MSNLEQDFINEFKKQGIRIFAGGIFILIGLGILFYFTMNARAAAMEKEQIYINSEYKQLKEDQAKVVSFLLQLNDNKVSKSDYIREMDAFRSTLNRVENKLDKLK
jgi:hypothetical protein